MKNYCIEKVSSLIFSFFFGFILLNSIVSKANSFDTASGLHCYREIQSALSYPKYIKKDVQRYYDEERNIYYVFAGGPDFPPNTVLLITESGVYSAVANPALIAKNESKPDAGKIEIKGLPKEERIIVDYFMDAKAKASFSYLSREDVAKDMEKNPLDRVQGKITVTPIAEAKMGAARKAFQGSIRDEWNLFHSSQSYFRQLLKNLGFTATDKAKAPATEEACKSTFAEAGTAGCNDASVKCEASEGKKSSNSPEGPESTKSGAGSAK